METDGTDLKVWGYSGATLLIDTTTGELVGEWVPIPGEADERLDFPTPAELCRCCRRALLTSGSKFSIWFCDACGPRVSDLNRRARRCVIPRGRHSLCNGIGTKHARRWHDEDLERFIDDMRGVWGSTLLLIEWAHEIVRRNCVALGLDSHATIPLDAYLAIARYQGIAKRDAFTQMLAWWADR